jgi:hypothetical protein
MNRHTMRCLGPDKSIVTLDRTAVHIALRSLRNEVPLTAGER